MNWGFLLFRGSYTYKKGLIVQSSSKTTQLLDPLFLKLCIIRVYLIKGVDVDEKTKEKFFISLQ